MNRHKIPLTVVMLGLFVAVSLLAGTSSATAADSEREDRWQFYIPITFTTSETFSGQGGSSVDLSGDVGFGFAFGYNFDERWMLGFEFTWLNANYDATIVEDTDGNGTPDRTVNVGGTLDSSTFQITGQFNFLETRVTPFIKAGLGSTYTDSNIPTGPPQGTCWWHPWWGYICGTWQPTYDKNSFSYGAAIGVRGDLTDTFYLEASANQLWVDFDRTDTPSFTGYRLNIGWLF